MPKLRLPLLLYVFSSLLLGCTSVSKSTETTFEPANVEAPLRNEALTPHLYALTTPTKVNGGVVPHTAAKENVIVRTYFATNRMVENKSLPSEAYGGESSVVSYGVADVSIPRDHRLGTLEGPTLGSRPLEGKHIVLIGLEQLDREKLLDVIKQKVGSTPGKNALVFIHGYNVPFEEAARRTAQLSYDLGFDGAPIFYSWPSYGNPLKYKKDGDIIERATPLFTTFLEDVFKHTDADNVYLIAHSMGNRAMAAAMTSLIKDEQIRPKVKRLIFTAPDIEAEKFEREYAPALVEAHLPMTIYASSKDLALMASVQFNKNRRLGDTGTDVSIIKGMETIDASAVKTGFLGHSYFAESGSVVSDIFYMFRTDLTAGQRFNMKGIDAPKGKYWAFQPGLCKP